MQKAKVPDYLPNKPTVVASRGANMVSSGGSDSPPQAYFNKNNVQPAPSLPVLNNPY